MRILYHHRTAADDGQAVHIRSLVRAFRERGDTVREVSLVAQSDGGGDGRSRWGFVRKLPRFALELAEYAYTATARRRLVAAGQDFGPDLLYERYAFGNAGGVAAARRLRRPLFLEVNSPMVLELTRTRGLAFPALARRVERFVFRESTRVCVVTQVLGDMLVEEGVERERLLVTPNGVDLALYARRGDALARAQAREALGLPPDGPDEGPVLGFVGFYRDWHRLDLAVAALREPGLERARLALVGEGPAREALEAEAARLGVADRVRFAGRFDHDRVPALLPAFDVALIPAINPYASPLKLHEYMAASLPTVAPDQPNLREVLAHDRDALLTPAGDADAFAAAVVRLARDGALRERLGAAARATVEARDLTWAGNARRVVAEAERALERGEHP